jgi:hypothetical protein
MTGGEGDGSGRSPRAGTPRAARTPPTGGRREAGGARAPGLPGRLPPPPPGPPVVLLDYALAGLLSAVVAVVILLGLRETVSDVLAFIARVVETSTQH